MEKGKMKAKKKKKESVKQQKKGAEKDEVDESDKFDFGGLPDRNLKKNLGCG